MSGYGLHESLYAATMRSELSSRWVDQSIWDCQTAIAQYLEKNPQLTPEEFMSFIFSAYDQAETLWRGDALLSAAEDDVVASIAEYIQVRQNEPDLFPPEHFSKGAIAKIALALYNFTQEEKHR